MSRRHSRSARRRTLDPRHYQIAVLTGLLLYGTVVLDFGLSLVQVTLILVTAQLTQFTCTRLWKLPRFDPLSAMISGLSLSLLLRTNHPGLAVLAAVVTIASKFLLRRNGKHIFNPTNFGLVMMMVTTGLVWVSPAQWGSAAFFGFLLACLGGLVINRASRSDVTYAFLGFYVAILFARALWLGDPMSIATHQLQNGAFLIFAFFMISDPKTTPDSRAGRIVFALLVASVAAFFRFQLFWTNGLLWSLALFALTVPLLDRLLPGRRYHWIPADPAAAAQPGGRKHEPLDNVWSPAGAGSALLRAPGAGLLRLLRR